MEGCGLAMADNRKGTPIPIRKQILFLLAYLIAAVALVEGLTYRSVLKDQELRSDLSGHGERTTGTVTRMHGRYNGTNGNTIDMRFVTKLGRVITASYGDGISFPERPLLHTGMTVAIIYDPQDPSRAMPEPLPTIPPQNVRARLLFMMPSGL